MKSATQRKLICVNVAGNKNNKFTYAEASVDKERPINTLSEIVKSL